MTSTKQTPGQAEDRTRTDLPDFVDFDQLVKRLYLPRETVLQLRRHRMLPRPNQRFESQELWFWPHVSQWAQHRGRSYRMPTVSQVIPSVDLVALPDIAKRLDVPDRVLRHWMRSGRFPDPDYRWSHAVAWVWKTVEDWSERRHGRPSTTPLWGLLDAKVAEARRLMIADVSNPRLRSLIEEVATGEVAVLGRSSMPVHSGLSDAQFLARFDAIRDRLEEMARELHAAHEADANDEQSLSDSEPSAQ